MKKKINMFKSLDFKHNKIATILYFALRFIVIILLIYNIIVGRYENAFTCLLVLVLLLLPFILEEKLKIEISSSLEVVILLFIFAAQILGELNAFYQKIPNWDTMLHTINGFVMGAVGFSLVNMLNDSDKARIKLSPIFLLLASFCFSMTIGVLWEVFEYSADCILGVDMQKDTVVNKINSTTFDPLKENEVYSIDINNVIVNNEDWTNIYGGYIDIGLHDTMKDLIVNALGAIFFSVFGYFIIKSKKNLDYEKLIVIKKRNREKVLVNN